MSQTPWMPTLEAERLAHGHPVPIPGGPPVLQQGRLGDLIVGHWLSERVNLLENELTDLCHRLDAGDRQAVRLIMKKRGGWVTASEVSILLSLW